MKDQRKLSPERSMGTLSTHRYLKNSKVFESPPLRPMLDSVIRSFEVQNPDLRASILLYRHGHLYHGSAPSIDTRYSQAIDGIRVGPKIGTCGSAVSLKKRVISADLRNDQNWEEFEHLID